MGKLEHKNIVKIYHTDTDCYNVVWHGSYIKWFEVGRVELSALAGIPLDKAENKGITFPVVDLNCRYKAPSKLYDEICITTSICELKKSSIKFSHKITNTQNNMLVLEAITTLVTTNTEGKLYRKMPDFLYEAYQKALG